MESAVKDLVDVLTLPATLALLGVLAFLYGCPPQHEDDTREPFAEARR